MSTQISQSEKIRRMVLKGSTYGQISKKLGIRYQTVWRTMHRDKGLIITERLLSEKENVDVQ